MHFHLSREETKVMISALREAAASCNTFINQAEYQGYTKQAVSSESKRLGEIWSLIERLEGRAEIVKHPGSTGTIDPYDFSNES